VKEKEREIDKLEVFVLVIPQQANFLSISDGSDKSCVITPIMTPLRPGRAPAPMAVAESVIH